MRFVFVLPSLFQLYVLFLAITGCIFTSCVLCVALCVVLVAKHLPQVDKSVAQPVLEGKPIAHRGAGVDAPENTLSAIRQVSSLSYSRVRKLWNVISAKKKKRTLPITDGKWCHAIPFETFCLFAFAFWWKTEMSKECEVALVVWTWVDTKCLGGHSHEIRNAAWGQPANSLTCGSDVDPYRFGEDRCDVVEIRSNHFTARYPSPWWWQSQLSSRGFLVCKDTGWGESCSSKQWGVFCSRGRHPLPLDKATQAKFGVCGAGSVVRCHLTPSSDTKESVCHFCLLAVKCCYFTTVPF